MINLSNIRNIIALNKIKKVVTEIIDSIYDRYNQVIYDRYNNPLRKR